MYKLTVGNKIKIILGSIGAGWSSSSFVVNLYTGPRENFGILAFMVLFIGLTTFIMSYSIYENIIPNTSYGGFLRVFPGVLFGISLTLLLTYSFQTRMTPIGFLILTGAFVISLFYIGQALRSQRRVSIYQTTPSSEKAKNK
ncbi:MAG: hypothetical protein ACXAC7_16595 [Candidatus Hodarchaeales archaeon]|jgi:hypothetical protein